MITAKDGREGLITATSEHPDLIILDVWTPQVDGLQMLRDLRRDSWGEVVPVILLTNSEDSVNEVQGEDLGTDDYMIKSHSSLETILKVVKQRLSGF